MGFVLPLSPMHCGIRLMARFHYEPITCRSFTTHPCRLSVLSGHISCSTCHVYIIYVYVNTSPSVADYELLAAEIQARLAQTARTEWDNEMLITEDFLLDRKNAKREVRIAHLFYSPCVYICIHNS